MLYGVYPYVIEKVDAMLATGARFGFQLMRDGSLRRLDCHVFDGLTFKSFVLAVVPAVMVGNKSCCGILCPSSHVSRPVEACPLCVSQTTFAWGGL